MRGGREEVKGQDDFVSTERQQQRKVYIAPWQQGGCEGELNSTGWPHLLGKQPADSLAESPPCPASILFPIKETATSHKLLLMLTFRC